MRSVRKPMDKTDYVSPKPEPLNLKRKLSTFESSLRNERACPAALGMYFPTLMNYIFTNIAQPPRAAGFCRDAPYIHTLGKPCILALTKVVVMRPRTAAEGGAE